MMTLIESRVSQEQLLEESEHTFVARDGVELFYRAWLPQGPARRAVVLFHRGHEHSGRWDCFVRELGMEETAFFAWDARGHGKSPGQRGYAEHFSTLVDDADHFVGQISREHEIPMQNIAVVAHSVGAVIAAAWAHDYAPPLAAMVLATPALRVKLYVPFANSFLRAGCTIGWPKAISSYVKPKMLTHDPAEARRYSEDPLISRRIAVNILLEMRQTADRLIADAGAIRTPTMLLTAGSDWVVRNGPSRRFLKRMSAPLKKHVHLDGFHHAIFHETDSQRALEPVREFLSEAFARPRRRPSLRDAHQRGYTRHEFDRLAKPLSGLNPKRLWWGAQKLQMRTTGRLSRGIRIGWESGFDSGRSLDYVYANRADGFTPLGRMIDCIYLNAIGWRGIRQRKIHLQQMMRGTIHRLQQQGQPVRIVDIAAGPGRYLLQIAAEQPAGSPLELVLRDHTPAELEAAGRLAEQLLSDEQRKMLRLEIGDAFDPDSLAKLQPKPSLAIVSGLYELFGDNQRVLDSLRGLSSALKGGGYLIYTNQPWHPQVQMIARVLINRDHQPWIMRRRTQEEMDELVRSAGFAKVDMLIDPFGIFTVSLARQEER